MIVKPERDCSNRPNGRRLLWMFPNLAFLKVICNNLRESIILENRLRTRVLVTRAIILRPGHKYPDILFKDI